MSRNNLPIGIFDSGVGGLTVFSAVAELMPHENLLYLGDTARVPYGARSPDTILKYAQRVAGHLVNRGVKALIIACNTATSYALDYLKARCAKENIPVIGVIQPGAIHACKRTKNLSIGVLGTEGTINGGCYEQEIHKIDPRIKVSSLACPLLVPLIEEGWIEDEVTQLVAKKYLTQLKGNPDTVILGCTHYPLVKQTLQGLMPHVEFVDSATSTAKESIVQLRRMNLLKTEGKRDFTFLVTDNMERFGRVGYKFLNHPPQPLNLVDLTEHDASRLAS